MNKFFLILFSFLVFPDPIQEKPALIFSLPTTNSFVTIDLLNNIYITSGNCITKYDKSGKMLVSYSDKQFGKITFTDATDPFKVLVFYREFEKLVFLDNMLSPKWQPISLQQLQGSGTSLACHSTGNCFWIYNSSKRSAYRYNKYLDLIGESTDLINVSDKNFNPILIKEYENKLYLVSDNNLLVLDIYGTYLKTIPIKTNQTIVVINEKLYYADSNYLKTFYFKTLQHDSILSPVNAPSYFCINNNFLYLSDSDSLRVFRIK